MSIISRPHCLALPAAALAALLVSGCGSSTTGDTSYRHAAARDTSASNATGTLTPRSNGGHTLTLSRDGTVCSGRFEKPAVAKASELARLQCSGGAQGTATLLYDGDAKPDRVVYAVNGQGGGNIKF